MTDIADLRREYARAALDEADAGSDPFAFFARWWEQALASELTEPNAMTLATTTPDGVPSARVVLLKGVDHGFVFFTDYRSRKGRELEANPHAALVLYWAELERQVRIVGRVSRTTRDESETYYRSRPEASRLGAWASHQSQVVSSRAELDRQFGVIQERYIGGEVPLPPYWGGYRVVPDTIEFWQGRRNRLHDRLLFRWAGGTWKVERLSP